MQDVRQITTGLHCHDPPEVILSHTAGPTGAGSELTAKLRQALALRMVATNLAAQRMMSANSMGLKKKSNDLAITTRGDDMVQACDDMERCW